ncbi:MAG: Spermidine synthase [candidate division WWE3 bacterium GW2011_GWA2_44_16]|uniref:Spermidine synthase n=1 Tax=candidate division WWE3 bacterium GW2011_GWA2_44_16 TaxID=1619110 RepID=A0A0G1JN44_UNCKA|nr:MAG: Spermidine synthase [candidate division WWE3 bacterium GW2011_GWA2_44_16]
MSLISYFVPKTLYSGSSAYNTNIQVIQVTGACKLLVNGTVQSFSANSRQVKAKVWGKMANIIVKEPKIKNLLLLGMGAGTLLGLLHRRGNHTVTTTSVEIDPIIIALAKTYFALDRLNNNTTVRGDAYTVVQNPSAYNLQPPFDCIVIDTYSGSDFPSNLTSDAFYTNVLALLSMGGLLVINRIISKDDKKTLASTTNQLENHIQPLRVLKVKCPVISDNYILYGLKAKSIK